MTAYEIFHNNVGIPLKMSIFSYCYMKRGNTLVMRLRTEIFSEEVKYKQKKFTEEVCNCIEFDCEYTEKYHGISDAINRLNTCFRVAADYINRRNIRKSLISSFK